jgi:hypothetical protein
MFGLDLIHGFDAASTPCDISRKSKALNNDNEWLIRFRPISDGTSELAGVVLKGLHVPKSDFVVLEWSDLKNSRDGVTEAQYQTFLFTNAVVGISCR